MNRMNRMNSEQVNQRICEMAKASKMPRKNKNEKNLVKGARGGTPTLVKDKTISVFSIPQYHKALP